MKNIHVIPTPNSSRLVKQKYDTIDRLCLADMATKRAEYKRFNIYITSDELIKDGYYLDLTHNMIMKSIFYNSSDKNCKKIILTTNKSLDGVQAIDDEFLEWFVKNPSCEEVKTQLKLPWESSKDEYEIIIPKEEPKQLNNFGLPQFGTKEFNDLASQCFGGKPKQETLEEAAENYVNYCSRFVSEDEDLADADRRGFIYGAKWQQERIHNDEDIESIIAETWIQCVKNDGNNFKAARDGIIKQFKKL